ncbi:hypothetical protein A4A49_51711 [Nicotiana attenuata]|uniref:Ubiquitin-like protease family profile domain-containing protein n=1 Tax=Nicotiana attenuata TaxID=49451 RepID=A0A314L6V9_NICAT|nr:hypothetical protein A4A49_51711 [Nicotiana attenuata]
MGEFRKLLQDEGLENKFRSSPFEHFLDLPKRPLFQASIVHGLLLRRVLSEKTQELWFDYKRLPVCFSLREFTIMHGLNCGHSYTNSKLQKYLLDVRLASTEKAFYNYPWGRNSFRLTIDYLMKDMKERQQYKDDSYNIYEFPWAFMALAFEAIPQLRPTDFPKERTLPRMKRWLFEKVEKDRPGPFQIKDHPVVHPFLYPTKVEKMKPYIQNLVIYMMIDNLSKELDGLTVLRHLGDALIKIEKGSLQTRQVGDSHVERYSSLCDGVDKVNAALYFSMILNEYQFHKDDLKYARGELPFCGGRPGNESKMLIYDCNTSMYTNEKLGEFLYPIGTMFPRYFRSCGSFMHLPKESLNDDWIPERVFDLPRDDTSSSCGVWSLMFIEHLITKTPMDKMNGNIVSEFREWLWISFRKIWNHDMICN